MRDLQLTDIRNSVTFQEFCEQLLSAEYNDFRAIDDTGGDEGCDGLAQNDTMHFQFYYPDQRGPHSERMSKVRRKITKDLKKLRKPYPSTWILVTTAKVSQEVHRFCRGKEEQFKPMRIQIWTDPRIKALLEKHPEIKRAWLAKIYGETIEVVAPEAVSYSQRNDIDALVDLDKRMGKSLSDWELGDKLKQVHTYDSTGNAKVSLVPKDPSQQVPINFFVRMKFDRSEEGEKKMQELLESQRKGTQFSVDGRFLDKVELKIDGRVTKDLTPKNGKGEFTVTPHPSQPIPASIDLFAKQNLRLQRLSGLELKAVRSGTEEAELNNIDQRTERIKVRLDVNRKSMEIHFNLSFDASEADSVDGLRYAKVLCDFHRAQKVLLFVNNAKKGLEVTKKPSLERWPMVVLDLSKKLVEIQDAVGESIPSLFVTPPSAEVADAIMQFHSIVTKGKIVKGHGTFEGTLRSANLDKISQFSVEKEGSFKLASEPIVGTLLGREIQLGHKITYFNGVPDPETRRAIELALKERDDREIHIKFVSKKDSLPTIELYPWWIRDAERKIAEFERERFKQEIARA